MIFTKHNVQRILLINFLCLLTLVTGTAQESSIARTWIEATLHGIRNDLARPTVHARNLFHTSVIMYDTWAIFDETAEPFLIGQKMGEFKSDIQLTPFIITTLKDKKEEVMSHALYRLLYFRFTKSPKKEDIHHYLDSLMDQFGYSTEVTAIDYSDGTAATLGNFIASEIIRFGLMDGSNEQNTYANQYYQPVNDPLLLTSSDPIVMTDPNRWQPLSFETFIDQGGNVILGSTPPFLGPEWGNLKGFALTNNDLSIFTRNGDEYRVYHDPSAPPMLGNDPAETAAYKWNFSLVANWASHLNADDPTVWDISPNEIGNVSTYPKTLDEFKTFYQADGGTSQSGYTVNPVTNQPYEPQLVPRGDYTRVLAEFWADGPDSETPPGHWFTILNYVMDHPQFEPIYMGSITFEDRLEYDVKAYFMLGAAMHDVAITAWSIKGWYDYVRPISAIRYMATIGQSSDSQLPNYHAHGIPLEEGLVELVQTGDPLAANPENIGKIKIYTWRGHDYITDPTLDDAGVGWILGEDWWPYQRPSFVTPPFAGYISGHSTYSSAGANILTQLTGMPYFPGGLGEFHAPQNDFLVFEKGPSVDVTLQWATYKDAADQCSLSRIWGGIHPPADDIPGRIIGPQVAHAVWQKAQRLFNGEETLDTHASNPRKSITLYPNPALSGSSISIQLLTKDPTEYQIYDHQGQLRQQGALDTQIEVNLPRGMYFIRVVGENTLFAEKLIVY